MIKSKNENPPADIIFNSVFRFSQQICFSSKESQEELNFLASFLQHIYKVVFIIGPFLHSLVDFKSPSNSGYQTWQPAATVTTQKVTALAPSSFSVPPVDSFFTTSFVLEFAFIIQFIIAYPIFTSVCGNSGKYPLKQSIMLLGQELHSF